MAMTDILDAVLNRVDPHSSYVTMTASAGAAAHVTLRTIRAARRLVLRPIRIAVRFIRGLLAYAIVIGSVWALLHYIR
ncbi:hypothetical protein [Mycolicibacterium chlorophenolicum]|uniref:Uncharacterized protein n=1 Tax=Mycolicibacterium chlorophenolicum TaxID=37916 RepID=A0A0J6WL02_9MYCO|nr:hypothetical protein [Mycolicibacterium chlorophenolicum]KMO82387.1 hypothetical protein MCHLDSM_01010 [Mycolicibacterium chlorophenolicum]